MLLLSELRVEKRLSAFESWRPTIRLRGPPFLGAPVRPNMLNMPKSASGFVNSLAYLHGASCCTVEMKKKQFCRYSTVRRLRKDRGDGASLTGWWKTVQSTRSCHGKRTVAERRASCRHGHQSRRTVSWGFIREKWWELQKKMKGRHVSGGDMGRVLGPLYLELGPLRMLFRCECDDSRYFDPDFERSCSNACGSADGKWRTFTRNRSQTKLFAQFCSDLLANVHMWPICMGQR